MKLSLTALLFTLGLLSVGTLADPLQVKGGRTTMILTDSVVDLFSDCEVERIKPALAHPKGKRLSFAISGGVVDPNDLVAEVDHRGGVSLSCMGGEPETLSLQNFRLDMLGADPVISAVAALDGAVQGRVPVLIPGGEDLDVGSYGSGSIKIDNADLIPTFELQLLLEQLGLILDEAEALGTASSRINVRKEDSGKGEDGSPGKSGDAPGQNKDKDKDDDDDDDDDS